MTTILDIQVQLNFFLVPFPYLSLVYLFPCKCAGPNHYWLNTSNGNKGPSEKDGMYLILADQFLEMTSSDSVVLVENVKFLQQR